MVAGDDVHALGGFAGQLVDLGFDVFGGLFGVKWSVSERSETAHFYGHAGQGAMVRSSLPCSCSSGARGFSRFDVAQFHFRAGAVSATRAAPAWGLRSGPPGPGRPLPPDDQGPHPYY